MRSNMHPLQFSAFRILLGMYLMMHFVFLLPFSAVLFSDAGMISSPELNPTFGLFPINVLNWLDDPRSVNVFLTVCIFLSLSLIVGFKRRWASALLLYCWIALFNRNNLILTPGLAFIGWLLLVMIFIPDGEPYSISGIKNKGWEMPVIVFAGAWFIMALSYSLSGIDKLSSPSWTNGTAFQKLLYNPLIWENALVDLLRSCPDWLHRGFTYMILLAELLFFPLAFFNLTRPFIWTLMVCIHLGILLLMNLSDLSIAMLMIHVFTFDPAWLRSRKLPVMA